MCFLVYRRFLRVWWSRIWTLGRRSLWSRQKRNYPLESTLSHCTSWGEPRSISRKRTAFPIIHHQCFTSTWDIVIQVIWLGSMKNVMSFQDGPEMPYCTIFHNSSQSCGTLLSLFYISCVRSRIIFLIWHSVCADAVGPSGNSIESYQ